MTQSTKKRKVDVENRIFNPEWTMTYFFIERLGKAQCLICLQTVAVCKEYNLRRHWETQHQASKYALMSPTKKQAAIVQLSNSLTRTTSLFVKSTAESDKATRVSYDVSLLLAKRMKPFSDGDFVKDCLIAAVKTICPERIEAFQNISLSSRTVCRRIEEMSNDVQDSMKSTLSKLVVFSLALDESTDVKDTAQLAIFIRGVTAGLDVREEFLQLTPLHNTTTGQDIFSAVLQCVEHYSLDLSRLVCVTTDGAPSMTGEKKGAASLLVRHCESLGHTHTIHKLHCIIHQQALCAKSANLADVMSVVIKVVNSLLSSSLKHRRFRALLDEVNAEYGDLLYFSQVRWLSRAAVLSRVCELQWEIAAFLEENGLPYAENFSDKKWLARLAFLTDMTSHLNTLNVNLQGKNNLVTDMFSHITAFEVKLRLWENHLIAGQLQHFPHLTACASSDLDLSICIGIIKSVRDEFAFRFAGFREQAADFKLVTGPFQFPVDDAPDSLQMELVELQCNDEFKAKYHASTALTFFRDVILPTKRFPHFIEHVQRIVAMFGSTYSCEQLFSKMKYTKSRLRSNLSDRHLNDILQLAVTSTEPRIDSILLGKQHQPSH
jgi:hypothetical protein